ncbi:hypothetical protein GCM10010095_82090 [Streptomyces anthocyanicus]|uniref:MbtH family protein n=1 Tax=Streptomyces TaxID=1883 RepID=UPI00087ADFE9|nr:MULTISPECIES: MbtH family NRPS accessory protein [Streptomyces]REH24938.1 MbtH protein [Streptomyces sp. 2221.1]GGL84920.1 hypothetical protein GCM10010095_82090 [Streptomyces anthocyanicus]SDT79900.1 MbtH protein [Streptomyces sp. 2114.2]
MHHADNPDDSTYAVVNNDEDQYSIWQDDHPLPPGWHRTGERGSRAHCLDHIARVWTDMRPASVRRHAQEL